MPWPPLLRTRLPTIRPSRQSRSHQNPLARPTALSTMLSRNANPFMCPSFTFACPLDAVLLGATHVQGRPGDVVVLVRRVPAEPDASHGVPRTAHDQGGGPGGQ